VIYEILSLGVNGVSKTRIIFRANLSYALAEKYVRFLVKNGQLTQVDSDNSTKYVLTAKGERLLELLVEVEEELADLYSTTLSSMTRILRPVSQTHQRLDIERVHVPPETQRYG
jgi:predicted transcriptional regulator